MGLVQFLGPAGGKHQLHALMPHIVGHEADRGGDALHHPIVGQGHHRLMKNVVPLEDFLHGGLFLAAGLAQRHQRFGEGGNFRVAGVADHGQHGAGLHDLPQVQQLVVAVAPAEDNAIEQGGDHGLGKTLADKGAHRAADFQHAHGHQDLDGLPCGVAGHAELLRQLHFRGDLLAGAEFSLNQLLGKRIDDLLHSVIADFLHVHSAPQVCCF